MRQFKALHGLNYKDTAVSYAVCYRTYNDNTTSYLSNLKILIANPTFYTSTSSLAGRVTTIEIVSTCVLCRPLSGKDVVRLLPTSLYTHCQDAPDSDYVQYINSNVVAGIGSSIRKISVVFMRSGAYRLCYQLQSNRGIIQEVRVRQTETGNQENRYTRGYLHVVPTIPSSYTTTPSDPAEGQAVTIAIKCPLLHCPCSELTFIPQSQSNCLTLPVNKHFYRSSKCTNLRYVFNHMHIVRGNYSVCYGPHWCRVNISPGLYCY